MLPRLDMSIWIHPQHDVLHGGVVDEGAFGVDKKHIRNPNFLHKTCIKSPALVAAGGEGQTDVLPVMPQVVLLVPPLEVAGVELRHRPQTGHAHQSKGQQDHSHAAPGDMAPLWALLLLFLGTLSKTNSKVVLPDVNVTCLVQEDCLLPCPFRPTGSVVIHWYKQQIPVHSFYYNKDQFGLQNKHFSGRTSLFNSQIPQGNASLLLKKVKVQDKGRYKCYTSTRKGNQEVYINLDLKAQIHTVLLEMTDEAVTCSSSNIYPVPQLTWTTDPPSAHEALDNATVKIADHKGLFAVESTLRIVGNLSDFTYICSLTSADKMQVWAASQKIQENIIQEEGHALSIPCVAPHYIQNYSLVWTLASSYEPVVILRYDNRTRQTSNLWEGQAELDRDLLLIGDGSLLIHKPDTEEHSGIYTCVFSNDQGRHTVKTHVNITVAPISTDEQSVQRSRWSTVASVVFVLMVIIVALPQFISQKEILAQTVSHHNGVANVHKGLNNTASYKIVHNGDGKSHVAVETEEEIQIVASSESVETSSQETQKAN